MTAPQAGYMTAQPQQGYPQQTQQPIQQAPVGQAGMVDQFGRPFQGQQQPQQQMPQQLQQQAQQGGLDINARLSGPAFPPELQGKTVGEAMRYYQVMKQDFLQRNQPQQQLQGQPQQGQQPQQFQQQAPQQQPAQQQRAPNGQYQQQPAQQQQQPQLDQTINAAVNQALAPVMQVSLSTVYQQVRSRFPDWAQYDAEIQEAAAGLPQQQLLSPSTWEATYFFVKGKRASTPQQQALQAQPQMQGQYGQPQQYTQQHPYNPQMPQQYQTQPAPQQFQPYFTESPTPAPPSPQGPGAAGPQDELMARRFNMPVEEYRAWKGGNVPQQAVPQQQGVQTIPGYQYNPNPVGQPNTYQAPGFSPYPPAPLNGNYRGY